MTFVAAAFCPHPPLLVTDVSAGEPVAVRAAALTAVRWLVSQQLRQVLVLGSSGEACDFAAGSAGSFAGYGVDRTVRFPGAPVDGPALPLPLAVGAWLLEQAGWSGATTGLTTDAAGGLPSRAGYTADAKRSAESAESNSIGLLVMGDGSARRSEKAPGWLDERAVGYDAAVSAALSSGEPKRLEVDLPLGQQLLAAGAPAWTAAARLLRGRSWKADVSYDDAPYGVGYLVATWTASPPS